MAKDKEIAKRNKDILVKSTYAEEDIRGRIFTFRGVQVMLDRDLAEIYGVETKVLNQAVKRNINRFPMRFMFQLTQDEYAFLRSQIVTIENLVSEDGRGRHTKYLPFAFTEQGISQLSSVLKSERAIEMSICIIDAFVTMRRFMVQNSHKTRSMDTAFEAYNKQYPNEHVKLHVFNNSHDRWLIVDDEVYHFGASIKDLGKKWFEVSRITEYTAEEILSRLK